MIHIPFLSGRVQVTLTFVAILAGAAVPAGLAAQRPTPAPAPAPAERDTAVADSVARLPDVRISVTTRDEALERVPWSVGVADVREIRHAQPTSALSEALGGIPGAFVAERQNYAVDSRISIRGFGSRANFGVRGIKLLLDGIPQSLPDGQSQATNVELGVLRRVEVLRGSASSLYGNGSGGVVAFETDMGGAEPWSARARVSGGGFGTLKWQGMATMRQGPAAAMLSLSRLTTDGFRDYSAAEVRQLNAGLDYALGAATTASVRLNLSDMPEAANPGPLTREEYEIRPDTASLTNIIRGADKRTSQHQLGVIVRHSLRRGAEFTGTAYGLLRDVRNALGVQPPPPRSPENGTYNLLERTAGGARLAYTHPFSGVRGDPGLTLGVEWSRMQDMRENWRATGGRPVAPDDTLLLAQKEDVTAIGPFAQIAWVPHPRLSTTWGVRWDRTSFAVDDRFLQDGDESGRRSMPAWSGHAGASFAVSGAFIPYANVSTAFETPTTTELQVSPDGGGGFNPELGPQRTLSIEFGARGATPNGGFSYSAAAFRNRVSHMIVQYLETGGRAWFVNAGGARNSGTEVQVELRLHERVYLQAAHTWAHYRYHEYRLARAGAVDTLDGNVLPGIPEHTARFGLRATLSHGFMIDVDHTIASSLFADDANEIKVEGWGGGVTNVRASWSGSLGRSGLLAPFAGVQNLWDQRYIGAVTVNGFGGRVLEPAPGRNIYAGLELSW